MNTAHRTTSHAKRKYAADPLAIYRVLNRIEPFDARELLRLELPIRMSYEAIKTGQGSESDFHDLAAAVNATLVRSEDVDPLCIVTAELARDALMRTWRRFEATGKWGFDGPALAEVEAGIALHEQLIRNSTPLQMMQAMRKVIARGKAGAVAA